MTLLTVYYIHTDHLGSYCAITDAGKQVKQRNYFDPWGNFKWISKNRDGEFEIKDSIPNDSLQFELAPKLNFTLTNRGFTGHEHYPQFKIINMNGRLYDPVIARFFSPDKYVANSTFTQDFNRYTYCRNNPLSYTDPSGQFLQVLVPILVGAVYGAMQGTIQGVIMADAKGATGSERTKYIFGGMGIGFGIGALSGYAGGALSGALSAVGLGGFAGGAIAGATIGLASGALNGLAMGALAGKTGRDLGEATGWGALMGFGTGVVMGGLMGGIKAKISGRSFWDGSFVYKSPVGDNFTGKVYGDCGYNTLDECSKSYKKSDYNYNEWKKLNNYEQKIKTQNLFKLINETSVFTGGDITEPNINKLIDAFLKDQRVLVSFFVENGDAHLVMASKIKVKKKREKD